MESESQTPDNKVFIGGLLPTTTRESLMQHMSVFGELSECKIVLDKQTGLSKGYGFVVYTTNHSAEASVAQGFILIDGKNCNCNLASLRKKNPSDTNNPNKKRGFPNFRADGSYDFDKRQRTDQPVMYPPMQPYVTPMVDPQMQLHASMQSLYGEVNALRCEVSVLSQNVHQMKQTLSVMKASLDSLCQRSGITVPPTYPTQ